MRCLRGHRLQRGRRTSVERLLRRIEKVDPALHSTILHEYLNLSTPRKEVALRSVLAKHMILQDPRTIRRLHDFRAQGLWDVASGEVLSRAKQVQAQLFENLGACLRLGRSYQAQLEHGTCDERADELVLVTESADGRFLEDGVPMIWGDDPDERGDRCRIAHSDGEEYIYDAKSGFVWRGEDGRQFGFDERLPQFGCTISVYWPLDRAWYAGRREKHT